MSPPYDTRNTVNFVSARTKQRIATAQWPLNQPLPRIGEGVRMGGRNHLDQWFRITDVIWDLVEGEHEQRTIAMVCEHIAGAIGQETHE